MENLPDIQLDGREVVDDDSDIEVDPKSLLQEPLVEACLPLAKWGQLGAPALPRRCQRRSRWRRRSASSAIVQGHHLHSLWPWSLLSKFLPLPAPSREVPDRPAIRLIMPNVPTP